VSHACSAISTSSEGGASSEEGASRGGISKGGRPEIARRKGLHQRSCGVILVMRVAGAVNPRAERPLRACPGGARPKVA